MNRRDKEKLNLSLEELQKQDLDDDQIDEEIMKARLARAQERLTLKHKNHNKFGKNLLSDVNTNPETRKALMEQFSQHEKLMRKVQVRSDSKESSEDEDAESNASDDDDASQEQYNANMDELLDDLQQGSLDGDKPTQGLFGMKFMQAAREKKRQDTIQQIEEMKREFDAEGSVSHQTEDENGRRAYTGIAKPQDSSLEDTAASRSDDESPATPTPATQSGTWQTTSTNKSKKATLTHESITEDDTATNDGPILNVNQDQPVRVTVNDSDNPWLSTDLLPEIKTIHQKHKVDSNIDQQQKMINKMGGRKKVVSPSDTPTEPANVTTILFDIGAGEPENGDVVDNYNMALDIKDKSNERDPLAKRTDKDTGLTEEQLVQLTFGQDDGAVEKDFEKEKRDLLQDLLHDSNPQLNDLNKQQLPGWGSWGV